jgi:hypothetical protein
MLNRFRRGSHASGVRTKGTKRRATVTLLVGYIGVFALTTASSVPASASAKPAVFPVNSKPFGASYGTWSARWWQFVYQFPIHNPPYTGPIYNPLFDETGSQCTLGQAGRVWYMVGVFNESGSATRSCTVPSNVALFFPILNTEWDNNCIDPPLTVEQLRQIAAEGIDLTTELHASFDGAPLTKDLFGFRATSPVFTYVLPPDDNIAQLFGCDVSGVTDPAVADGYYLMMAPLTPGQHTLNFGGTLGDPINFSLDITYNLTVTG